MEASSSRNPASAIVIHPEHPDRGAWPPAVQYPNVAAITGYETLVTNSIQVDNAIGKITGCVTVPLLCKSLFTFALILIYRVAPPIEIIHIAIRCLPFATVLLCMIFSQCIYRIIVHIAPRMGRGFRIGVLLMSAVYIAAFIMQLFAGS